MPMGCIQKKADNYEEIKTLNYVAVQYFELGMWEIAFQIWKELYAGLQENPAYDAGLGKVFPVVSCNFGNALRKMGYEEDAYLCCRQGLQCCFETGWNYAVPELVMQLSALYASFGEEKAACSMFFFGKNLMDWGKRGDDCRTLEDISEQDFLLYCQEDFSHIL